MSFLYKYRSLDDDSREFVERIICNHELFFSKPSSFNDPFDCTPCFLIKATKKEIIKEYKRLLKKFKPELNRAQRRNDAFEMINDPIRNISNPEAIQSIQQYHAQRIKEEIGVFCLSTKYDDILMWSHYADSHRGICLKFSWGIDSFENAQEVKYPPQRPRINPFSQSADEMMEIALLTKSSQWSYENEWRAIQYEKGPGIYKYPEKALEGIIFGAEITDDSKSLVMGWLEKREHPVKLYSASPSDTQFSLNIEEIQ